MTGQAARGLVAAGLAVALAAGVVASSLALVSVKHETRQLFVELEQLNGERDELQIEWGQLQIEQSTWATHARMETLGRGDLALVIPAPDEIVLLPEAP